MSLYKAYRAQQTKYNHLGSVSFFSNNAPYIIQNIILSAHLLRFQRVQSYPILPLLKVDKSSSNLLFECSANWYNLIRIIQKKFRFFDFSDMIKIDNKRFMHLNKHMSCLCYHKARHCLTDFMYLIFCMNMNVVSLTLKVEYIFAKESNFVSVFGKYESSSFL